MKRDINYWNNIPKPNDDVDVTAEEGDIVVEIGGLLFLVQTRNNCNNIVCFRVQESNISALKTLFLFREYLLENTLIRYIRVEGNTNRYKFLEKLKPCEDYRAIQDKKTIDKNVFYIRLGEK